jgi:arylsulfatase A-like enzyme
MHAVDWYPTFLELVNISDTCKNCDGISQKNALLHGTHSARSNMLYDCFVHTGDASMVRSIYTNAACGVRDSQYKLLHHYADNSTDRYFTQYSVVDSDDDLDATQNCITSDSGNNFTVSECYSIHMLSCCNVWLLI